jgi:hypothetical protein
MASKISVEELIPCWTGKGREKSLDWTNHHVEDS